mgnify:CR=1 FL=1|jgi:hypothetical protein
MIDKKDRNSGNFQNEKGKELSDHLDSINMDPWYIIYGKYINPKSKSSKTK